MGTRLRLWLQSSWERNKLHTQTSKQCLWALNKSPKSWASLSAQNSQTLNQSKRLTRKEFVTCSYKLSLRDESCDNLDRKVLKSSQIVCWLLLNQRSQSLSTKLNQFKSRDIQLRNWLASLTLAGKSARNKVLKRWTDRKNCKMTNLPSLQRRSLR